MKIKGILITILIIIIFALDICAQKAKVDSLINLLEQHPKEDTVRVNLLNDIAYSSLRIDHEKSLNYAENALKLGVKLNFKKGIANALNNIGVTHKNQGNYPIALESYQKSLEIVEELGDKKGIVTRLNNIGGIFKHQGNYPLALEYFHKSLKISEENNYKQGIVNCLIIIGNVHSAQGNYPLTLECFQKSLDTSKEIGDKLGIAFSLNNIGIIHERQGNYPQALDYYRRSLKIKEKLEYKSGIGSTLNNIGIIHERQGNHPLALDYYQQSLKIKEELGEKSGIARRLKNIGHIYDAQGKYPRALEYYQRSLKISEEIGDKFVIGEVNSMLGSLYLKKHNYNKALSYTLNSLNIAKELEALHNLKDIYKQLADIYEATQNYKLAFKSYVLYKQHSDSIFNKENIRKITGLEYQYEFDKEKQAIQLGQEKSELQFQEKIKRERIIQYSAIGGFLLVILLAFNLYRQNQIQTKTNELLSNKNKIIEEGNEKLKTTLVELKTTQNSLIQSAKMASIGILSAGVAHEINNPLNFIKGGVVGLTQHVKKMNLHNEDKINKFVNAINEGMLRATSFIRSLSSFSKHDTSMNENCDVHAILENCLIILQGNFNNKIIVNKKYAEDMVVILGNDSQLHQALFNILINAVQSIKESGEIKIITTHDSANISISIKDTGEGIENSHIDQIMIPLFTTKDPGAGMGFGLSIAYKNIERHGGQIIVSSEIGVGTEVRITLPIITRSI